MEYSRIFEIEKLAGEGNLNELKKILEPNHTQSEINTALGNAIAYSQIQTAQYLLSHGADLSAYDYDGVYYAVHNNELEGLKFSISMGVDINVNNGLLLNTGIITTMNCKSIEIVKWILENGANPKLLTKSTLEVAKQFGSKELNELVNSYLDK